MRVFFIGNVMFSRSILESILPINAIDVVGIATKSKSNFNADQDDISDVAKLHNIDYKYVKNINAPHITSWIKNLKPDVIYCMGWSSLINQELLNIAPKGVIGYHPTDLPKNRGRHPLIWALVLGLEYTASTFFKIDDGADTGDIASQKKIKILEEDTASTLYDKLIIEAKIQIKELTLKLKDNSVNWTKQPDEETNYWRKRSEKDGEINFSSSTQVINNLVRALTKPYIGAHLIYNNTNVKIWSTKTGPKSYENYEPGKVLDINKNQDILVKTADGSVWIVDHEFTEVPKKNSYII